MYGCGTSASEVMSSSLFVCLLATLRRYFQRDLHEIFREVGKQTIKFLVAIQIMDPYLDPDLYMPWQRYAASQCF